SRAPSGCRSTTITSSASCRAASSGSGTPRSTTDGGSSRPATCSRSAPARRWSGSRGASEARGVRCPSWKRASSSGWIACASRTARCKPAARGRTSRACVWGGCSRGARTATTTASSSVREPRSTCPALGGSWLAPTRADAPLGLLRLRAAYGVAGRRPLLSAALAAERTRELEGGADAALWDSRLQLGVTLYDRRTSGVVVPSASAPSGLGIANLGRLSNRGIEIALTAEILRGEARSWDAWLTAWGNRNRITTLGGPPLRFALTTGDQVYQEGLPAGAYSMLPIKRYSDANGDGIITPSEVVV